MEVPVREVALLHVAGIVRRGIPDGFAAFPFGIEGICAGHESRGREQRDRRSESRAAIRSTPRRSLRERSGTRSQLEALRQVAVAVDAHGASVRSDDFVHQRNSALGSVGSGDGIDRDVQRSLVLDDDGKRYAEYGAAVMPIIEEVGADTLFHHWLDQALEGGFDPDLRCSFAIRPPSLSSDVDHNTYGQVARSDPTG